MNGVRQRISYYPVKSGIYGTAENGVKRRFESLRRHQATASVGRASANRLDAAARALQDARDLAGEDDAAVAKVYARNTGLTLPGTS
jgi:hypothetical protein